MIRTTNRYAKNAIMFLVEFNVKRICNHFQLITPICNWHSILHFQWIFAHLLIPNKCNKINYKTTHLRIGFQRHIIHTQMYSEMTNAVAGMPTDVEYKNWNGLIEFWQYHAHTHTLALARTRSLAYTRLNTVQMASDSQPATCTLVDSWRTLCERAHRCRCPTAIRMCGIACDMFLHLANARKTCCVICVVSVRCTCVHALINMKPLSNWAQARKVKTTMQMEKTQDVIRCCWMLRSDWFFQLSLSYLLCGEMHLQARAR